MRAAVYNSKIIETSSHLNKQKKNIIISEYEDDDLNVRHVSETSIANITQTDCIIDLNNPQYETIPY